MSGAFASEPVPRLLGPWPSDISLLIVHGLALLVVVILYISFEKNARDWSVNNDED